MTDAGGTVTQPESGYRIRLFIATTIVIGGLTGLGAGFAHRYLPSEAERELQASIDRQIETAAIARQTRQSVLTEICHNLSRQPRIHAALEDNALDLLYPSAHNELRQITREWSALNQEGELPHLRARFYRFLDLEGAIITPENADWPGQISNQLASSLPLAEIPPVAVFGYFFEEKEAGGDRELLEVITVPIISNESFEPIAALIVGFPFEPTLSALSGDTLQVGIWSGEELAMERLSPQEKERLISHIISPEESEPFILNGIPQRVIAQIINPQSPYPPAYEIAVASLAEIHMVRERIRNRILLSGSVLILIGLAISHWVAQRFTRPVEALAEAREAEHSQRVLAEAALDRTSRDLERAAHFSADASHQLKTPVAVMRAGLEEMLMDSALPENLRSEVQALIRQTGRLTSVIEDLLLLSRLDAGQLQVELKPVPLLPLIEGLLDDFSVLPDNHNINIHVSVDKSIHVRGEKRYTSMILQSLLENARKYNRQNGSIRVSAQTHENMVHCLVGNTGKHISESAKMHIFERFHRGASGENIPGYGLGLNLARELARLHGGELHLHDSRPDWTEFELILPGFPSAMQTVPPHSTHRTHR